MSAMKLLLSVVTVFLLTPDQSFSASKGAAQFQLCVFCHGAKGEGNQKLGAPAIAGMPAWYVEAQVKKFKDGVRGSHAADAAGLRMRPMARTIRTDEDIKAVAEYVAGLTPTKPVKTLDGDATRGQPLYAACLACHGPDGMGNQAMNAPALVYTNDWYLFEQLKKFKNKMRGADPAADPNGALMAGMANTLMDEQAMKDVLAYIHSLK